VSAKDIYVYEFHREPFQSTVEMIPFSRLDDGKLNHIESAQFERLLFVEIKHHQHMYGIYSLRRQQILLQR